MKFFIFVSIIILFTEEMKCRPCGECECFRRTGTVTCENVSEFEFQRFVESFNLKWVKDLILINMETRVKHFTDRLFRSLERIILKGNHLLFYTVFDKSIVEPCLIIKIKIIFSTYRDGRSQFRKISHSGARLDTCYVPNVEISNCAIQRRVRVDTPSSASETETVTDATTASTPKLTPRGNFHVKTSKGTTVSASTSNTTAESTTTPSPPPQAEGHAVKICIGVTVGSGMFFFLISICCWRRKWRICGKIDFSDRGRTRGTFVAEHIPINNIGFGIENFDTFEEECNLREEELEEEVFSRSAQTDCSHPCSNFPKAELNVHSPRHELTSSWYCSSNQAVKFVKKPSPKKEK